MDIVVDTSVLIAVISNEAQRDRLVEATKGADLLAPASVHWEVGNALSAMLKRRRISLSDALEAIRAYQRIPVRVVDIEIEEAIKTAAMVGVYAYDAYIIRCALKHNAPVLSLDHGLRDAAQRAGASVVEM